MEKNPFTLAVPFSNAIVHEHTPTSYFDRPHLPINYNKMADSQVDEFCRITGASREKGALFLQTANGNLQAAMDAFYSDDVLEVDIAYIDFS